MRQEDESKDKQRKTTGARSENRHPTTCDRDTTRQASKDKTSDGDENPPPQIANERRARGRRHERTNTRASKPASRPNANRPRSPHIPRPGGRGTSPRQANRRRAGERGQGEREKKKKKEERATMDEGTRKKPPQANLHRPHRPPAPPPHRRHETIATDEATQTTPRLSCRRNGELERYGIETRADDRHEPRPAHEIMTHKIVAGTERKERDRGRGENRTRPTRTEHRHDATR